ncbi:MAG: prepilin-type N-terminal cleavage/methylation domain-containing protein [Elusimicrobia bacterium]|nr:prepilin-type N-terminal cleavage/methylation domain-containing protein [Elusimicrobiota bacterium]
MKLNKKGFTLIELMIVVAIIGILAAIAIPKFADLINKSKEGATKGALSSVRSALQVYYGDNEGIFPRDTLSTLTSNAKYITDIPLAKLPGTGHTDSKVIVAASSITAAGVFDPVANQDAAGWVYLNDNTCVANWGTFVASCTHSDLKGTTRWTMF